ncbi:MAG: redox-sensing transcriptional repressor Rex [Spirochaetales bacterium]|nr:redox-sensing transcriptional repressor Rex [Spirochaetales bacterium]
MREKLPEPSIQRLCLLYRLLSRVEKEGRLTVNSGFLAEQLNVKATSIRRDISLLGEFGNTIAGYEVQPLKQAIFKGLGLESVKRACIVGLGRLGASILNYQGFLMGDVMVVAGFDSNINMLEMMESAVSLYPAYQIDEIVRSRNIEIGIITVPMKAAQGVADKLIQAGIKGILNFTPVVLKSDNSRVTIRNLDFFSELLILSAAISLKER